MANQKQKFALFTRLAELGFTYDEAAQLRRIEMTLQRWSEAECNGEIQRNDETGKPYRHNTYSGSRDQGYPIADREAGALKRLAAIVKARNERETTDNDAGGFIIPYHQGDPRGCALYLVKRSDIPNDFDTVWCGDGYSIARKGGSSFDGKGRAAYGTRFKTAEEAKAFAFRESLSSVYTRGLAVCA